MQAVALIHEEDGVFGVSFPDFPGATTVGKTPDEAIAKAAQVLAFHVEGLAEDGPVPTPRTLSTLQSDKEFKKEAVGALVALVPYSPPTKSVRINMTIDEGLLHRADAVAAALGETRSGFIADALKHRMMGLADSPRVEDIAGADPSGGKKGSRTQVTEPRRKRA